MNPFIQFMQQADPLTRDAGLLDLAEQPLANPLQELSGLLADSKDPSFQKRLLALIETFLQADSVEIPDTLVAWLEQQLSAETGAIRFASARLLARIWMKPFDPSKAVLESQIQTSDAELLPAVLELCGWMGNPAWIPLLEVQSRHSEYFVRQKAVEALGKIGGESVLPALLNALFDPEKEVREAALWGLDIFWAEAQEDAVPSLINLLNQLPQGRMKDYVVVTLRRTNDPRLAAILVQIEEERVSSGPLNPLSPSARTKGEFEKSF
jgi:hypothetical protein